MKKVLLAAAFIGGTFFSANAVEIASENNVFGCIDVLVHYATTTYHDAESGSVSEVKHYRTETRCTSTKVTVTVQTINLK